MGVSFDVADPPKDVPNRTSSTGRRQTSLFVSKFAATPKQKGIEEELVSLIGQPLEKSSPETGFFRGQMRMLRDAVRVQRDDERAKRDYTVYYDENELETGMDLAIDSVDAEFEEEEPTPPAEGEEVETESQAVRMERDQVNMQKRAQEMVLMEERARSEERVDSMCRLEDFLYDNIFSVQPPAFLNFPEKFPAFVEVSALDPNQKYKSMIFGRDETAQEIVGRLLEKYRKYIQGIHKASRYGLKVVGRALYIPPNFKIGTLPFVHEKFKRGDKIYFSVVDLFEVSIPFEEEYTNPEQIKIGSIWNATVLPMRVKEEKASKSYSDSGYSLFVEASLGFGGETIGRTHYTKAVPMDNAPLFDEWLETELSLEDLPSTAVLSFTLWMSREKARNVNVMSPNNVAIAWINCVVSDYRGLLRQGQTQLAMWTDDKANPIGTTVTNAFARESCPLLNLHFDCFLKPVVCHVDSLEAEGNEACSPGQCRICDTRANEQRFASIASASAAKAKDMNIAPEAEEEEEVEETNQSLAPQRATTKLQRATSARLNVTSDEQDGPSEADLVKLDALIKQDSLATPNPEERALLWRNRQHLTDKPLAILKFLHHGVNWRRRMSIEEAYKLISQWKPLDALDALELLDARHANPVVRAYGVKCLEGLDNNVLFHYLLQLVQVLKYEPFTNSALWRFLLSRALRDNFIGHSLYWYLKSEIHVPFLTERFSLYLEAYLRGCGFHQRFQLKKQVDLMRNLESAALLVKTACQAKQDPSDIKGLLQQRLAEIRWNGPVQLPVNHMIEVDGIIAEKCRFMDSKKKPLWITFKNADERGDPVLMMYKSGDDLRQDMLTLQIMRIMDLMWQDNNLDLRLIPYGAIATGDETGMLEIVLDSNTAANITREVGGGAAAAFKEGNLTQWLRNYNPSDREFKLAQDVFVQSVAGYCVATYVLGIGDRHNDNIMLQQCGNFFHIDFGHFLGNFKKKFGFERERAPFILTPDMAHVMGGSQSEEFQRFLGLACEAFEVCRQQGRLFINLFTLMLSTGIPELKTSSDVLYIRDMLFLDSSVEEAAKKYRDLADVALHTKTTQVNDFIHLLAHR